MATIEMDMRTFVDCLEKCFVDANRVFDTYKMRSADDQIPRAIETALHAIADLDNQVKYYRKPTGGNAALPIDPLLFHKVVISTHLVGRDTMKLVPMDEDERASVIRKLD